MNKLYLSLFVLALFTWLVYSVKQKRKRTQAKADFYALNSVSEKDLRAWMPLDDFEILHRFEPYTLSEMNTGHYHGFDFALFLLSYSAQQSQCFRQTVAAIKLGKRVAPFKKQSGELWVECNGEVLVVYQQKQSMTCGAPMELFLNRIIEQQKLIQ